MTQTQDEQNVQASGSQAQGTNPVVDEQNVQATAPDLSAVDLASETPVESETTVNEAVESVAEQPAAPVAEQPVAPVEVQLWDVQQPIDTNPMA